MALGLSSCGLFVDGNFCTRNLELLSEKHSLWFIIWHVFIIFSTSKYFDFKAEKVWKNNI